MIRILCTALLLAAGAGCETLGPLVPSGDLRVRSGTSAGMCLGYCSTELVVQGDRATLVRTSRDWNRYPPRTHHLTLTAEEQRDLHSAVDAAAFRSLADVYGCPDCADGGAEWIELDGKRVVFEAGADIPAVRPLLREVRELRARFQQEQ